MALPSIGLVSIGAATCRASKRLHLVTPTIPIFINHLSTDVNSISVSHTQMNTSWKVWRRSDQDALKTLQNAANASALPLNSLERPKATTAPHAEAASTRAMSKRVFRSWMSFGVSKWPVSRPRDLLCH